MWFCRTNKTLALDFIFGLGICKILPQHQLQPNLPVAGGRELYIRKLKMHHHIFAIFLQTVYAIENILAGFNVQHRIGMNQSLI